MLTWLDRLDPDKHQRFYCNPGEKVESTYEVHYDKNGVRELRDMGKHKNTFDEIQSYRESCDIEVILKKYYNGDYNALNRNEACYIDCTQFPESYAEWFERGEAAKRYFYSLDPDVRAQYNNSFEQFLTAEVPATFDVKPKETIEKEVEKDES